MTLPPITPAQAHGQRVREALCVAGLGPDRVVVTGRQVGGHVVVVVTLREDGDADAASAVLREAGWCALEAGARSVMTWLLDAPS